MITAICDRDKIRVQPSGVLAAHLLGLSDRVPAKYVFLTDGTCRTVKAGALQIALKHISPKKMATVGRLAGLLIQAFKSLGPEHIDRVHLAQLKTKIPSKELKGLLQDIDAATA